ncbi:hypothetical protein H4S02_005116 [Coemansia sp. RSA 2611]|nr:hypothetical protein H4S02_005116 [Coemansia sp. RSA 2611]KAJ2737567.1 hypothetical protein H4R23_001744 [Coemansia sp. Cherry 401B]
MPVANPEKPKRIAVVGSGLAGLTTAYLLQKSGCEVELFEKADSVGMDAGSLSVDGVRIDVPFRVFTPDYYPYLYSLYSHLGIEFAAADYSLGFADEHAASIWSYTNTTLDDFQMPIPDGIRRGHRLAVTRDWVRLVFACVKIMRVPALLRPGGYLDRLTIGEYLKREQYDPVFTDRVFIPFIASLLTCSLSAARMYPATTILHFVSKAVCGSRLRKAKNGVQEVCEMLTQGLCKIHLGTTIDKIELSEDGGGSRVLLVTGDGKSHWFDEAVLATPADTAARLLRSIKRAPDEYPPSDLLEALDSVPYEDTLVVTHRDESVMPARRTEWRGVNIRTARNSDHAMASHWINYVEHTASGRELSTQVFQTVDPLVKLDAAKIISKTYFHRSLVTLDSQARINNMHRHQGRNGVWFVGTYTSPGVPLLEGCVRTAVDVVRAMGCSVPFAAPRVVRTSRNGGTYEVGLGSGMARGEVLEGYFEHDAAGTFHFRCPLLYAPSKRGVGIDSASLGQWLWAWSAWLGFAILLPLLAIALAAVDAVANATLGRDLGCRVQLAAMDIGVYIVCMGQVVYRRAMSV